MFEKFRQFITLPQKIAQIPEAMRAEPTGSTDKIEQPTIKIMTATISDIMKTTLE